MNTDEKGGYLGKFEAEDRLLVIYNDGNYEITDQELTQRFETEKVLLIEKFDTKKTITAVYFDKEKLQYSVKRFKIETSTLHNKFFFIKEGDGNYLKAVTTDEDPILAMQSGRGGQVRKAKVTLSKVVDVMGWKALGNKLADYNKSIEMEWVVKSASNPQAELFE